MVTHIGVDLRLTVASMDETDAQKHGAYALATSQFNTGKTKKKVSTNDCCAAGRETDCGGSSFAAYCRNCTYWR